MQTGDADLVTVPPANRSQMDALVGQMGEYDASTDTYGALVDICGYDGSKLAAEKFVPCEAGLLLKNPFVVRMVDRISPWTFYCLTGTSRPPKKARTPISAPVNWMARHSR